MKISFLTAYGSRFLSRCIVLLIVFLLQLTTLSSRAQLAYYIQEVGLTANRFESGINFSVAAGTAPGDVGYHYDNIQAGEFTLAFPAPSGSPPSGYTAATAPPPNYSTTFRGYCVELYQPSTAYSWYQPLTMPSAAQTQPPYWDADGGNRASYLYYEHVVKNDDVGNDPIKGAAMQIAIWHAVYGSRLTITYNPSVIATAISDQITAQANTWYNNAVTAGWQTTYQATWWQNIGNNQDYIGQAVPEPVETGLASLAIIGLFAAYEFRKRRNLSKTASA